MNKDKESDSWGQLLSDFGIKDQTPEETAPPEEPKPIKSTMPNPVASDHVETDAADSEPKEKKSIFSRFPKINFFGAPPDVSLDSVIEGTKSPSLGGKAFTDNKLEKMPVSQERTDRQKKNRPNNEPGKVTANTSDAWSTVASQIDTLASGGDAKTQSGERPAKRTVSSMFDDPIPESDEARALKNLMGEQSQRKELHRDAFHDEESDSRQRGRGRRQSQPDEQEARGRGSRYRPPVEVDDVSESDFVPMKDESPRTRGRGRRDSRYSGGYRDRESTRNDAPQEEWSEVDAALQAGRNDSSRRGGGRRQRYDEHRGHERVPESKMNREPLESDDSGVTAIHGNIPSWDDAIGAIISGNVTRHKGHSHSGSGRGRR